LDSVSSQKQIAHRSYICVQQNSNLPIPDEYRWNRPVGVFFYRCFAIIERIRSLIFMYSVWLKSITNYPTHRVSSMIKK